jgi:hypothetical protein
MFFYSSLADIASNDVIWQTFSCPTTFGKIRLVGRGVYGYDRPKRNELIRIRKLVVLGQILPPMQ